MPTDLPTWLAAVGGLSAAALGVVNVGLAARFTHRTELRRWQREIVLPLVVTFNATSRRHLYGIIDLTGSEDEPRWADDGMLFPATTELGTINAEVELVAPTELSQVTDDLYRAHMALHRTYWQWRDADDVNFDRVSDGMAHVQERRRLFLRTARRSLGIARTGADLLTRVSEPPRTP